MSCSQHDVIKIETPCAFFASIVEEGFITLLAQIQLYKTQSALSL